MINTWMWLGRLSNTIRAELTINSTTLSMPYTLGEAKRLALYLEGSRKLNRPFTPSKPKLITLI
jgi:hypothetical protein